jgi:hypothetical protein
MIMIVTMMARRGPVVRRWLWRGGSRSPQSSKHKQRPVGEHRRVALSRTRSIVLLVLQHCTVQASYRYLLLEPISLACSLGRVLVLGITTILSGRAAGHTSGSSRPQACCAVHPAGRGGDKRAWDSLRWDTQTHRGTHTLESNLADRWKKSSNIHPPAHPPNSCLSWLGPII